MKKLLLCVVVSMTITTYSNACDICGCGAGNSYIGILPDFYKHIFGLRYRYNSLYSHLGVNGSSTYLTTKENYRIAELWGGWTFAHKYRLMVSLPYSFNERLNSEGRKTKTGISDVSINFFYELLNKKNTLKNHLLVQSLWIGGGVKLATGAYNPADKSGTINTNLFQLGTGSTDFLLSAMYDIRLQDAGLNINAGYRINTSNSSHYRYGNKLNLSTQLYYKLGWPSFRLAPNAGFQCEWAQQDKDGLFKVDLSGGNVCMVTVGLETSFKKIAVGGNWQKPITQQMANGFVKANNRFMLHCSYTF